MKRIKIRMILTINTKTLNRNEQYQQLIEEAPHYSKLIEEAWNLKDSGKLSSNNHEIDFNNYKTAVERTIQCLDKGIFRVAEKNNNEWIVNLWLKKAILLNFYLHDSSIITAGQLNFFDKVDLKFSTYSIDDFQKEGVRVVPGAIVRSGSYIAPKVVLMPSYVNIGAYVDEGTMVDTWATVGSCAQIGKNVHLSGGVGIGGVLEPLQANPVIIEDNCFIGARSEVVEGVIVEENSVLSMGVYISQSTKIYNRATGEIFYGRVPSGSVVVPGSLPSADGSHSLYCAIIVKQVDAQTRAKTAINELLRY
jgi:2,3,4,5-tetrahydropyridine-2,6-dicarboxylate N-succinyltransferase